jgi:hypothetical protein
VVTLCMWPDLNPGLSHLFVLDFWTLDSPPKPDPQVLWRPLLLVALIPLAGLLCLISALNWVVAGFAPADAAPLIRKHRIQDVLALIQLLALHQYSHRSENGLAKDTQGAPRSATSWTELAGQHPELFRVDPSAEHKISLIARHAISGDSPLAERSKLAVELTRIAVDLHDRQERQAQRWQALVPLASAAITAAVGLAIAWLSKR